jgi:ribosomal protein S18 acetylase RimI-like enzyme
VGTGQAVLEAGWGGVQCMATLAGYRGRGAASAILASLASGAAQAGVERMYLAVQADNPAITLYERAGFSVVHAYEYLTRRYSGATPIDEPDTATLSCLVTALLITAKLIDWRNR